MHSGLMLRLKMEARDGAVLVGCLAYISLASEWLPTGASTNHHGSILLWGSSFRFGCVKHMKKLYNREVGDYILAFLQTYEGD